jgi:septum formation protein
LQTLVLASGSPWRKQLLEAAGLAVRAVPADVDERSLQAGLDPQDPGGVAVALARAKALDVAGREPGVVLGADQVLWDGEAIIGKPPDPAAHLARLRAFRGRSHDLLTAWCLAAPGRAARVGVVRTRLTVRADLTDAELQAYVASGEGSGCAGGYAIEGHGAWLFERVDGDWTNIIGLPLFEVLGALRDLGWRYPAGG